MGVVLSSEEPELFPLQVCRSFFFCTVLKVMFIIWYIIFQILAVLIHTCPLYLNRRSHFFWHFLAYEYCFDFWELSVVWQLNVNCLMLNLHNSKNDWSAFILRTRSSVFFCEWRDGKRNGLSCLSCLYYIPV